MLPTRPALPELKRVIVAFGDQVVMEENLELALQRLFGGKSAPTIVASAATAGYESITSTHWPRKPWASTSGRSILQRQGNWAGYGEELRKLEQVLKRMAQ